MEEKTRQLSNEQSREVRLPLEIIDSHSQLPPDPESMKLFFESQKKGIGYADIFKSAPLSPSLDTMIKDMDDAGVSKSVIVAIDAETRFGFKTSNEMVAAIISKYPERLIGFAGADPNKGVIAVKEFERAVKELGFKGLKLLPHLIELNPNEKIIYPLYEKAQQLDVPVLFHAGTQFHTGTRLKYCRPIHIDDVAVDFPNLKIIIAHFGWPWYEETIAICERHRNVYFNIAGWAPKYIPQIVVHYMNSRLSDKALFGSDYPLVTRRRILTELDQLELKPENKEKILCKNAKRILKIS
jgi:predicted TIM-barrel fold metal-dependent hydrolase